MPPEYVPSPSKFTANHVERYLATGGEDGFQMNGIECVVLTTVGRKSGALRRSPVVRVVDGDRYLVVGSMGGAPQHPEWYLNLLDNPAVTVQDRDRVFDMTARIATGEEYERLWQVAVAAYPDYAEYQTRTTRQIPVVVCEKRG